MFLYSNVCPATLFKEHGRKYESLLTTLCLFLIAGYDYVWPYDSYDFPLLLSFEHSAAIETEGE